MKIETIAKKKEKVKTLRVLSPGKDVQFYIANMEAIIEQMLGVPFKGDERLNLIKTLKVPVQKEHKQIASYTADVQADRVVFSVRKKYRDRKEKKTKEYEAYTYTFLY